MAGMNNELNLMATSLGNFYGSSANISGTGFDGMHFDTHSVEPSDFNTWVKQAAGSKTTLTQTEYTKLDQPSYNNPVSYYSDPASGLYLSIINKYLTPGGQVSSMMGM
jgi:cytochrome o ubiquinol oxidase subunit 2